MADIPSIVEKVQVEAVDPGSPVSQFLMYQFGGNINGIIDRKIKEVEFTASGFWTPPSDVVNSIVMLFGLGGGGGGNNSGGMGGNGCQMAIKTKLVTTSSPIVVTIGAGGSPGSTGGNTLFDGTIVCKGAAGGLASLDSNRYITSWQNLGGFTGNDGIASEAFAGGGHESPAAGGGGGASSMAAGGFGSDSNGSAGTLGSGGGAGPSSGGAGGSGYLKIVYISAL